jgi:hypothetical protein
MIGDTPFDAIAARRAGVPPLGVETAYFSAPELLSAGCSAVFRKALELLEILNQSGSAAREIRSIAAHRFKRRKYYMLGSRPPPQVTRRLA